MCVPSSPWSLSCGYPVLCHCWHGEGLFILSTPWTSGTGEESGFFLPNYLSGLFWVRVYFNQMWNTKHKQQPTNPVCWPGLSEKNGSEETELSCGQRETPMKRCSRRQEFSLLSLTLANRFPAELKPARFSQGRNLVSFHIIKGNFIYL